jgi:hypothetical protein
MKICFNLLPPANKLIAFLIGMLLILSFTKIKAEEKVEHPDNFFMGSTLKADKKITIKKEARQQYIQEYRFNHDVVIR